MQEISFGIGSPWPCRLVISCEETLGAQKIWGDRIPTQFWHDTGSHGLRTFKGLYSGLRKLGSIAGASSPSTEKQHAHTKKLTHTIKTDRIAVKLSDLELFASSLFTFEVNKTWNLIFLEHRIVFFLV